MVFKRIPHIKTVPSHGQNERKLSMDDAKRVAAFFMLLRQIEKRVNNPSLRIKLRRAGENKKSSQPNDIRTRNKAGPFFEISYTKLNLYTRSL